MKKVTLLALAAIMSLGLAGCAKEAANIEKTPETPGTDKLSIHITRQATDDVRAIEAPGAAGNLAAIGSNAWIFIANATGDIIFEEVLVEAEAKSPAGQLVEGIPSDAASVFIVANVTKPANFSTLAAIKQATYAVATFGDYTKAPLANHTGAEVAITPPVTAGDPSTVTVQISPVISRIELTKVRATHNGLATSDPNYIKITGFSVTGVYLHDYFTDFTLAGGVPAAAVAVDGTDLSGISDKPGPWAAVADGTEFSANPGSGTVWAHNVVAKGTPRFIIKIENVTAENGANERIYEIMPRDGVSKVNLAEYVFFLSMPAFNPYNEISGDFERAKIYNIGEVVFSSDNLFTAAPIEDGKLKVNVSIVDWTVVGLTNNLN